MVAHDHLPVEGRSAAGGESSGEADQVRLSRRRMFGGIAAVGAGVASGIATSTGRDTRLPVNTAFGINVLDFIPNPSDPSSHTAGFEAAIAAAVAGDGDEIVIPAGIWYVEGLSVPQRTSLKFRGAGATAFPWLSPRGATTGTQLVRIGNRPIFNAVGPAASSEGGDPYSNVLDVFPDFVRDFMLEDMTLHNANPSATSPLIDMKSCSGGNFSRVVLYSPSGCSLISLQGVFDTRFNNCFFAGGGLAAAGLGAVRILGEKLNGDGTSYRESKELQFVNCHSESYFGPAFEIGDSGSASVKPSLILFTNVKLESQATVGPHILIGAGSSIMVNNTYISHWKTSGPIVDLQKCSGFYGSISFNQIHKQGWVDPSCRLNVSSDATLVNVHVNLLTGSDSNVNAVTIANPSDAQNNITISGASQLVNGTNALTQVFRNGVIRQRVTAETDNCEYVFSRGDSMSWSLGSRTAAGSAVQEFSVRGVDSLGHVGTFLAFRADGTDPATSTRTAVFGSGVHLDSDGGNAYINFPNQLKPPAVSSGVQLYAAGDHGHLRLMLKGSDAAPAGLVARDVGTYKGTATLGAAAQTDYIALLDSGADVSLPSAEANFNVYTLKNLTDGEMLVRTSALQTVEGLAGISLAAGESVTVVSDGANWRTC